MKIALRFHSQLLNRRSYKPGRRLVVAVRPSRRVNVPVCIALPDFAPVRFPQLTCASP
jgi:hypothetical protein